MENTQNQPRGRVVLLNALPLNSLPRRNMMLHIEPLDLRRLRELQSEVIIHFIRHSSTVAALRSILPLTEANSNVYRYEEGDRIVVITLRTPQRGAQDVAVTLDDLEAWLVIPEF